MNRTAIAIGLALLGTICWLAVFAGLLPEQVGWFSAVVCAMLSGAAWWLPSGRRPGRDD